MVQRTRHHLSSRTALLSFVSTLAVSVAGCPGIGYADDLTISASQATPVSTAAGDGTGPGDITIEASGAVDLTDGIPVTINSSNSVSNAGAIQTETETNATGVLVDTSAFDITGSITNSGDITLFGPADSSAISGTPTNNAAIRVSGPFTLTGEITNSGAGEIAVGGASAFGISVEGALTGSISNQGQITAVGANSIGIGTSASVSGAINNAGAIQATGASGIGLYVGGQVGDAVINSGTIDVGLPESSDNTGAVFPARSGDAGIWIAAGVANGLQISGNEVTENNEALLPRTDTRLAIADGTITAVGSGQAIRIRPGGPSGTFSNIFLGTPGTGADGFSFINRGVVGSGSLESGVGILAIDISGATDNGTTYTTRLDGGIANAGGDIRASAVDAAATSIRIGTGATVIGLDNSGDILTSVDDSTFNDGDGTLGTGGGDARLIIVESGGALTSVLNTGRMIATAEGPTANAYGIIDLAGSIQSIVNRGQFLARIQSDASGATVAFEAPTNTSGVYIENSGTWEGDVILGNGADTVQLAAESTTTGDFFMAGGNDTFSLNGATYTGDIGFTTGNKSVSFTNATLTTGVVRGGATVDVTATGSDWFIPAENQVSATSFSVSGGSTLRIEIDGANSRAGSISATGLVSIANDTTLVPTISTFAPDARTYTLIDAGTLADPSSLLGNTVVDGSYMHNVDLAQDPNNPNRLLMTVARRTSQELGLSANQAAVYDNFDALLAGDPTVFRELAELNSQSGFEGALQQLMPYIGDGYIQAAINGQNLSTAVISRRLDRLPVAGVFANSPTLWVQQYGNYASRKTKGDLLGYTSWAAGIGLGYDGQISETTRLGFGVTQLWSFPDEKNSFDRANDIDSTQVNVYLRSGDQLRHIQAVVSGGIDSYKSERQIVFGDIDRSIFGQWRGSQFSGSLQAAMGAVRNGIKVIPTARLSYMTLHMKDRTEISPFGNLGLSIDSQNVDSLRGTLGFTAETTLYRVDDSVFDIQGRAAYDREFINDPLETTASFTIAPDTFTLSGNKLPSNVFTLGLGIAYRNNYASVSFDYDGQKGSGFTSHTGGINIRFRF